MDQDFVHSPSHAHGLKSGNRRQPFQVKNTRNVLFECKSIIDKSMAWQSGMPSHRDEKRAAESAARSWL
jgi:hypothetical protein